MKTRLMLAGGLLLALTGCTTYDYVGGGRSGSYYHGAPSVEYRVTLTHGRGEVIVDNPARLPETSDVESIARDSNIDADRGRFLDLRGIIQQRRRAAEAPLRGRARAVRRGTYEAGSSR